MPPSNSNDNLTCGSCHIVVFMSRSAVQMLGAYGPPVFCLNFYTLHFVSRDCGILFFNLPCVRFVLFSRYFAVSGHYLLGWTLSSNSSKFRKKLHVILTQKSDNNNTTSLNNISNRIRSPLPHSPLTVYEFAVEISCPIFFQTVATATFPRNLRCNLGVKCCWPTKKWPP